jgi:type VI secretion system protein VasD
MLRADLAAAGDANSGGGESGRPVVVRLYELKASGSFSSADFFSLYERDAQTLGGDLIGREEVSLAPGQWHRIEKALAPDTVYIGVLVAFRDIDSARWRQIVNVRTHAVNALAIKVAADSVSVSAN